MLTRLQTLNQQFNYDWNDYRTFDQARKVFPDVVKFIGQLIVDNLQPEEKIELARLCYKLGTFFVHDKKDPDAALDYLNIVIEHEITVPENDFAAWLHNHVAYAYLQLTAKTLKLYKQDKTAATVLTEALSHYASAHLAIKDADYAGLGEFPQAEAFAYCLRALLAYEQGDLKNAIALYEKAFEIYKAHHLIDDQYARARNRYAQMLLENRQFFAAEAVFAEVADYWKKSLSNKEGVVNPHPAKFEFAIRDITMSFDRTTVHTVAKIIESDIEAAKREVVSGEVKNDKILKQLGIYYAFYQRSKQQAEYYLDLYFKTLEQKKLENTAEYAEIISYLDYVNTIDPNHKTSALSDKAYVIFKDLLQKAKVDSRSLEIGQAFALRYNALALHRSGKYEMANERIRAALKMQLQANASYIDVAESQHILGVILIRQNLLAQAEEALKAAENSETLFYHANDKKVHFMQYTTMQSLGSVWMQLGKHKEALDILEKALELQLSYFNGCMDKEDIGKTLHFTGEVLGKLARWDDAVKMFERALVVKNKVLPAGSFIIEVTQKALDEARLELKKIKLVESSSTAVNVGALSQSYAAAPKPADVTPTVEEKPGLTL